MAWFAFLPLAVCGQTAHEGDGSMNVAEHIISWNAPPSIGIRADPDGYLDLYANDATYFDPFVERRVDGREELITRLEVRRGPSVLRKVGI